jgi:hypothetical protein
MSKGQMLTNITLYEIYSVRFSTNGAFFAFITTQTQYRFGI